MLNCVYRFFNKNDEIIYIGKTSNGMKKRISEHFSNKGHLPYSCYKEVEKIDFCTFSTHAETKIYEIYLINYYKPEYNTLDKEYKTLNLCLDIDSLDWKMHNFTTINKRKENEKQKLIDRLRLEIENEKMKRHKYEKQVERLKERNEYLELLMSDTKQVNPIKRDSKANNHLGFKSYEIEHILQSDKYSHIVFVGELYANSALIERVNIKLINNNITYEFEVSGSMLPSDHLQNHNWDVLDKKNIILMIERGSGFLATEVAEDTINQLKDYASKRNVA